MLMRHLFSLAAAGLAASVAAAPGTDYSPKINKIIKAAEKDGIDLVSLPFAEAAFQSIEDLSKFKGTGPHRPFKNHSRVDVHVHAVPDFYHALVPFTGGSPTPEWSVEQHLEFMANNSITLSVLTISAPGSTVFLGNETLSVGLARLLNEWMAELSDVLPGRFAFYAVTPLPYNDAAIKEAHHALNKLKALGLGVLTNHEGYYLGNAVLKPFLAALNATEGGPHTLMVHPTDPLQRDSEGALVVSNPTTYPTGLIEFYFESARTVQDLILTRTLTAFTNLHWSISHVGGAFPSVQDRFLRTQPVEFQESVRTALTERVWYDSAGPTYFSQVKGLLAYNVSESQLVFGTDWPYSRFPYEDSLQAILDADFLTEAEKSAIFVENAEHMLCTHFH